MDGHAEGVPKWQTGYKMLLLSRQRELSISFGIIKKSASTVGWV